MKFTLEEDADGNCITSVLTKEEIEGTSSSDISAKQTKI